MTKNNDDEQVILEFGVQTFTLTDYTRYQEMVLMRIIKACQSDISDAITSYKNNNILVFSKEENSEQKRHRRLKLQLLEPDKTHYNQLKKALTEMSSKRIGIPYRQHSTAIQYMWFDRLFKASFCHVGKYDYVDLDIELKVLRYYLSNQMGYHRINLKSYFLFKHFASRQLLRFYNAFFSRTGRTLRLEFISKAFTVKDTYKSYSEVAKKVLEPARKEMELLYQNKQLDIHFKYKPDYGMGDDRTQEPERVKFFFTHVDDEHPQGARLEKLTSYQECVRVSLKIVWGLDERVAADLAQRIKYAMLPEVSEFFNHESDYRRKLESQGRSLRNPAGFMRNALIRFLEKWEEEYEGEEVNEYFLIKLENVREKFGGFGKKV